MVNNLIKYHHNKAICRRCKPLVLLRWDFFLCKNGVPSPSINKRGQSQNHLLLKKKFTKLWNKSDIFLYLQLISIRIAGTIRDFRITKFAQKDGLLAAFFELFFAQNSLVS